MTATSMEPRNPVMKKRRAARMIGDDEQACLKEGREIPQDASRMSFSRIHLQLFMCASIP